MEAISKEEERIRNMLSQKMGDREEDETSNTRLQDSDGEFDEFYDRTR